MGGGAWPFFVGGVIFLVNSVLFFPSQYFFVLIFFCLDILF